jgi:TolB protein
VVDSDGAALPGAPVEYKLGSTTYDFGTTDATGCVSKEFDSGTTDVEAWASHNSTTSAHVIQDISVDPDFDFQTSKATLRLQDCESIGLPGGQARYWVNGTSYWFPGNPTDASGEAYAEFFAGAYQFEMQYQGTAEVKTQDISTPVVFTTTLVTLQYSGAISYGGPSGDYYWFSKPSMELLPGTYMVHFRECQRLELSWSGCTFEAECPPYQACDETVRGEELGRGEPYWNGEQLCQQVTYELLDAYTGEFCDEETVEECEDYRPCNRKRRGEPTGEGEWYWNDEKGKKCRQVTYQMWDRYIPEYPCGERTSERCERYTRCDETVLGDELFRRNPTLIEGHICWDVTYQVLDAYDLDYECGTHTEQECEGDRYRRCTRTTRWMYTYGPYAWDPVGWDLCRVVTATKYDWYVRTRVCEGPIVETQCRGIELPRPSPGSCPECLENLPFQSDRHGNWEIYRADGCEATRLTHNDAADTAPQRDAAGQQVVFQSYRDGNWEIYTMDANGGSLTNVSQHPASDVAGCWANPSIYFQSNRDGNWEIYHMQPDGSGQTRITNDPASDAQPAVGPDGRVAFQSDRDGNWELYLMNGDGSGVQRLTTTTWDEVSPTWSPAGDRIAFQTNQDGTWRIAVMDLASGIVQYVTIANGGSAQSPMWYNSCCDWIFFQAFSVGDWDLYRVKPDGTLSERAIYYPGAQDVLDDQVIVP